MIDNEKFRRLLVVRRGNLEAIAESGKAAAAPVELDQAKVGRLSRMDALQAQAMQQETARRRELELRKIKAALQRLDNDDYGFCLRCDEPVSEQRLEVDPAATLCIRCAETKS